MAKPGRPTPGLDEYLYWQERLANREASDLSIDEFCADEQISRSTFYRWKDRLKAGVPTDGSYYDPAAFGWLNHPNNVSLPLSTRKITRFQLGDVGHAAARRPTYLTHTTNRRIHSGFCERCFTLLQSVLSTETKGYEGPACKWLSVNSLGFLQRLESHLGRRGTLCVYVASCCVGPCGSCWSGVSDYQSAGRWWLCFQQRAN